MGVNKESDTARAKRYAEIYVYEHPGNITQSYLQLETEYPSNACPLSSTSRGAKTSRAYRYSQRPEVQKAVAEERARAQVAYDIRKDEVVANLQRIAFDDSNSNKDRLQALKQLTDLGGFVQQNVNLNAKADIEVVIE